MFTFSTSFWDNTLVRSVQEGEITVSAGTTSNTLTLKTPVRVSGTMMIWNGQRCADATLVPAEDMIAITLTNGTTVTATTNASNATDDRTVAFTVIDFQPWAVTQLVYGSVPMSAVNTADLLIPTTDTRRSVISYLGQVTNRATYNVIRDSVELRIQSATTVRATRGNNTAGDFVTPNFCVVEFHPSVPRQITTSLVAVPNNAASGTATIASATPANSLTLYGGWSQSVLGIVDTRTWPRGELTNSTTLTGYVGAATSAQANIRLTVIDFNPRWIKSKQPGTVIVSSGTGTNSRTINSVNLNKTVVGYLNASMPTNLADNRAWGTSGLGATEVSSSRGGVPAVDTTYGQEVLEFQ